MWAGRVEADTGGGVLPGAYELDRISGQLEVEQVREAEEREGLTVEERLIPLVAVADGPSWGGGRYALAYGPRRELG